jgi:hypothetical protein
MFEFMNRILFILVALFSVGCQHTSTPTTRLAPEQCVEVGTVMAHGVWETKKALARAGIPAYTDGSEYPSYRILVPPEYRESAVAVLRRIEQRWQSVGYGVTHE